MTNVGQPSDGRSELDRLLSEKLTGAIQRERTHFAKSLNGATKIVLFGAGQLGRKAAAALRRDCFDLVAFADNDPGLWGKSIDGICVLSLPEAIDRFARDAAFVITIWNPYLKQRMTDRENQLRDLGCQTILSFAPLFWTCCPDGARHYSFDLPSNVHREAEAVRRACDLWSDLSSQREYLCQVHWRLTADFDVLPPPTPGSMYFPAGLFDLTPNEVFVDCGAYDGDTVSSFIDKSQRVFRRVVAFEPDPVNFSRLTDTAQAFPADVRARISTHNCAVSSASGLQAFRASGTEASALGLGDTTVNCVRLDDVADAQDATFIKMDIEGAESDALMGAVELIRRRQPILAICCDHNQFDLWRLPILIKEINPDYMLFLRAHLLDAWDVDVYAIPRSRVLGGAGGK